MVLGRQRIKDSPYRLHQSLIPNVLPGIAPPQPRNADDVPESYL